MNYREIRMGGIPYLLELRGSSDWYWGTDYASGDLHEAEEIAGAGLELKSNRLCFVSFPDGEVYEPVRAGAGQYFAEPIACEGEVFCLLVDFIQRWIRLLRCTRDMKAAHVEVEIGLDRVADTYNLALDLSPLMIVRRGGRPYLRFSGLNPAVSKFRRRRASCGVRVTGWFSADGVWGGG